MLTTYALALTLATASEPEFVIQRYESVPNVTAVRVDNATLAHTTQLLAADGHRESVKAEMHNVFLQLSELLNAFESTPSYIVKLNLYVDSPATRTAAMDRINAWMPAGARPAVAAVQTPLSEGRRFALDCVFAAERIEKARSADRQVAHETEAGVTGGWARVSLLPRGDAVYVSGQAQPGELPEATKATLEGLLKTLHFMELDRKDIVQVKCFLQPMKDVAVVQREIAAFFGKSSIPAVSYVEWIAGGSRPIEIEVVAAAPLTKTAETVSYITPPWMKGSPVFSRVARIHGNRRVYVSGVYASDEGDGSGQVQSIFESLIRGLKPTRANLRHMAKATYYVSDADVSSQLNKLRPHYYDPQRPPAASKAMIHGVAAASRSISIDMIAAPEAPLHSVLTPLSKPLRPTRKVVYKTVQDRPLHLHVFEPDGHKTTDRRPVLLAIHGGGWTGGNARVFFPFADHFAKQGMLGISLEYRLVHGSEGTTVFDCVRDARSAVRWIRAHAEELGIDPRKIVVLGGSAGGHLAVSTALFDAVNEAGDNTRVSARPDALLLMYPVIDTSADGYGQQKIGERWRELSPVHKVRAGLPPTLILHGTGDAVTPWSGARRFHEHSTAAGNTCELVSHSGGRHGYLIFDPQDFEAALRQMRKFIAHHGLNAE